jgi:flagellar biogenesis protein FliO
MEILSQVTGVAAVLGLLAATLWWLRRKGVAELALPSLRGRKRTRMERIERLALTPQHSLYLVRVANREMLIAVHPSGCTLLESAPARGEAAG